MVAVPASALHGYRIQAPDASEVDKVAFDAEHVAPSALSRQDTRPKFPLAFPTASLILSFFAGPAVVTVNVSLMLWNSRPIGGRAWRVLSRERRLNVDFLDTMAISVSMLHGAFLTAAIIVWLVRLGDWIRDLTAARSKRAVGAPSSSRRRWRGC